MNAEQFLYHEARLLDTQQLEDWLELFTEDATYWVPLERDQKDPLETSSIIHDDRTLLELRVKQARHPRAHARLPLARTVHQVGNVMVEEDKDEVEVHSTLQVVEFRNEKQRSARRAGRAPPAQSERHLQDRAQARRPGELRRRARRHRDPF